MAVERLKSCENIVALSEELGVHRRLLYKWRDQLEPIADKLGRRRTVVNGSYGSRLRI
jgi:transposase-like protein